MFVAEQDDVEGRRVDPRTRIASGSIYFRHGCTHFRKSYLREQAADIFFIAFNILFLPEQQWVDVKIRNRCKNVRGFMSTG